MEKVDYTTEHTRSHVRIRVGGTVYYWPADYTDDIEAIADELMFAGIRRACVWRGRPGPDAYPINAVIYARGVQCGR